MGTAPVNAIALPAVYRDNLSCLSSICAHALYDLACVLSRIPAHADAEGSAL